MFKLHNTGDKVSASVDWYPSQTMQDDVLVKTGRHISPQYRLEFSMGELSPAQRERVLKFRAEQETKHGLVHRSGPKLVFDREPTFAQIVEALEAYEAVQEEKRREQAEEASERVRQEQVIDDLCKKIWALEKAGDLEGLRAFHLPKDLPYLSTKPRPEDVRNRAIRNLEKTRREQEKIDWIEAHGSAHLNRACLQEGYNCQRLYVTERAAMEAPGFEVDFDDRAQWKDRSCPSAAALDLLDEARKLNVGDAKIVWLTEDTKRHDDDFYYNDEIAFEPREAVVIQNYLDQYWLVREV